MASELSEAVLGLHLPAAEPMTCSVSPLDAGCIGERCPPSNRSPGLLGAR